MTEETTVAERFEMTPAMTGYIGTIRRWSSFFAILGFIGLGLMVVLGFTLGSILTMLPDQSAALDQIPALLFGIIYVVMAAIYLYPVIQLYRFSVTAKQGLHTRSQEQMERAFRYLRDHFSYMGVLSIVVLSLYAAIMVIAVIAVVVGFSMAGGGGLALL